jgi:hypothetical protein
VVGLARGIDKILPSCFWDRGIGTASVEHAASSVHPEQRDKTVWEVFEAERQSLIAYRGPFDGFREVEFAVSKSSLVRFDHNRYSVAVRAARRAAQMRVYAERIVVWCDGEIVAEHRRRFGRGQTAYDPWHYLPVLARKPGRCVTAIRSATGICRGHWRRSGAG